MDGCMRWLNLSSGGFILYRRVEMSIRHLLLMAFGEPTKSVCGVKR